MSLFGNRKREPDQSPLKDDEDELAARLAKAWRDSQKPSTTTTTAPPGAKPEEGDMSGTFPIDDHLDEASKAALWMISEGKLTQIAVELSDFFGSNVNWRDVKKLAGLPQSARSSSKVQRKLVWDAVEELILMAMEEAEASKGEGSNADPDAESPPEPMPHRRAQQPQGQAPSSEPAADEGEAEGEWSQDPPPAAEPEPTSQPDGEADGATGEPSGEPVVSEPEPERQSPPDPEPAEAQAEAEPSQGGSESADPPEGEPQTPPQEGEAMEDHEITELRGLVAQMKAGYSVYQGLRTMDQYDRDRHLALHPESKAPFEQYQRWIARVSEIFKVEAQRQDPIGSRLPYGDKTKWGKWVWRKLQLLLHPDSTNALTRDELEALFANGRRANAGASGGSSQQSRQSGSSQQRSQQSQPSGGGAAGATASPAMVATARRFIEAAPIQEWATSATRTDGRKYRLWSFSAEGIRDVAFWAVKPFQDEHPDATPEEANAAFTAAFEDIVNQVFPAS